MTVRRWHVLKGNQKNETAHNCIFFDTETKPETLPDGSERDHLWFGWLCGIQRTGAGSWGYEHWLRFETVDEFWDIIAGMVRPRSKWFLFCHNTSFDLPVLDIFGASARHGWKLRMAVIEAPPTIITFRKGTVTLTFLDTLNWWRMPLAKLGKRIGFPKLDMPPGEASREQWDTYCRQDCAVIMETVKRWLQFLKDNNLGGFASTLAGQSFRSYRHRFMSKPIVLDADERALKLSREAYHGGRVECFRFGRIEGPVYYLDFNSMYPSVLLGNRYPCKLLRVFDTRPLAQAKRLCADYCVVARCDLDATAPCYPVMTKHGLDFPTGRFSTVLTTPEIALAIERGELLALNDIAIYEAADLFSDYMRYFWQARQHAVAAGDAVDDWLFKIMANSFYGKWGQTGKVYETVSRTEDLSCRKMTVIDADTGRVLRYRQLAGLVQLQASEGEARESFPAIAAHCTAYARVKLWKAAEQARLANVLYCDTDALFVLRAGKRRLRGLIAPTELGGLKQAARWDWIEIHGLKDYETPDHVVRKGIRESAIQIAPNTFRQVQWSSLKGLVGSGDVTAPTRRQIVKHLKREYRKTRHDTQRPARSRRAG